MPIQPGTRLGAYEVKSLIGQGAMGMVYLARHEALDRTAAVKVMLAIGNDPIAVGRFHREGQAIALLRHPNIVTVYDYGEYEGTPYMIEEQSLQFVQLLRAGEDHGVPSARRGHAG